MPGLQIETEMLNAALSVFQQQYQARWNLTLVGAMIDAVGPLTMFSVFSRYYIEAMIYPDQRDNNWEYTLPTTPLSDVKQLLLWGNFTQERISPGDTMFATTGRRLYVIGDIEGGFHPRSNPYGLYNFGSPLPDDPLANKLQGVWAQPVKALNGYVFEIEVEGKIWLLLDAWFTSLVKQRNDGEIVESDAGKLIAHADRSPDNWAVVVGGGSPPEQTQVIDGSDGHPVGQMEYTAILGVGDEKTWRFGVVIESEAGPEIASRNLDQWLPQYETLLSEKRALYETLMITGPQFNSPDERLNAAFNIARANMQMLEAESEALGRYFYAGLENFPFWFGNDGAYSAPGLVASSFVTSTKNHRLDGAQFNSNGRIPPRFLPQVRSSVWETRKKHLNG